MTHCKKEKAQYNPFPSEAVNCVRTVDLYKKYTFLNSLEKRFYKKKSQTYQTIFFFKNTDTNTTLIFCYNITHFKNQNNYFQKYFCWILLKNLENVDGVASFILNTL